MKIVKTYFLVLIMMITPLVAQYYGRAGIDWLPLGEHGSICLPLILATFILEVALFFHILVLTGVLKSSSSSDERYRAKY